MTDEEIIKKIQKGEVEIYSQLVDRYKDGIFGLIYKYTNDYNETQDIAQEVFIKVYKQLNNFRFQSKLSTWIYRIATNSCIDWGRRKKKDANIMPLDEVTMTDSSIDLESSFVFEEQRKRVRSIVNKMPDKYKLLVVMYHFHNLKYKDISEILAMPEKTVETRLYRARALIKKEVEITYEGGEALWNMKR